MKYFLFTILLFTCQLVAAQTAIEKVQIYRAQHEGEMMKE